MGCMTNPNGGANHHLLPGRRRGRFSSFELGLAGVCPGRSLPWGVPHPPAERTQYQYLHYTYHRTEHRTTNQGLHSPPGGRSMRGGADGSYPPVSYVLYPAYHPRDSREHAFYLEKYYPTSWNFSSPLFSGPLSLVNGREVNFYITNTTYKQEPDLKPPPPWTAYAVQPKLRRQAIPNSIPIHTWLMICSTSKRTCGDCLSEFH